MIDMATERPSCGQTRLSNLLHAIKWDPFQRMSFVVHLAGIFWMSRHGIDLFWIVMLAALAMLQIENGMNSRQLGNR